MLAAVDVYYDEGRLLGFAAAVVFRAWEDAAAVDQDLAVIPNIEPYVPGAFYRRELPCLVAVLEKIPDAPSAVVVDGYVTLDGKPGLGQHLYEHLERKVAVIGVAKTEYFRSGALEVLRGSSQSPLYVSAVGMNPAEAASCIKRMHGANRIPTLLKSVDLLGRSLALEAR